MHKFFKVFVITGLMIGSQSAMGSAQMFGGAAVKRTAHAKLSVPGVGSVSVDRLAGSGIIAAACVLAYMAYHSNKNDIQRLTDRSQRMPEIEQELIAYGVKMDTINEYLEEHYTFDYVRLSDGRSIVAPRIYHTYAYAYETAAPVSPEIDEQIKKLLAEYHSVSRLSPAVMTVKSMLAGAFVTYVIGMGIFMLVAPSS